MEYSLIFSKKRKTVSISVRNGGIVVRAPYGTSKTLIDKFVFDNEKWITSQKEKEKRREEKFESLTEKQIKEYKKKAKEYFTSKTEEYSKIMNLKYGRITITSAKKRFGSCSSQGNISYSYRLMLYPESAREYVVVHELAHIKEMNHSKRFYDIVRGVLPDYKERRQMLR